MFYFSRPITSVFKNAGSLDEIIKNQLNSKEKVIYDPTIKEKPDMIFSTKSSAAAAQMEEIEREKLLERLRLEKIQKEKEEAEQYAYQFLHTKPEVYPIYQERPETPMKENISENTSIALDNQNHSVQSSLLGTSDQLKEKKKHKHKEKKHKNKHRELEEGEYIDKNKEKKEKPRKEKKKEKKKHSKFCNNAYYYFIVSRLEDILGKPSQFAPTIHNIVEPKVNKPRSPIPILKPEEPIIPPVLKLEKIKKEHKKDSEKSKDKDKLHKDKEKKHKEHKEGKLPKLTEATTEKSMNFNKKLHLMEPPKLVPEQPIPSIPPPKADEKNLQLPKITEKNEKEIRPKEKEVKKESVEKEKSLKKKPDFLNKEFPPVLTRRDEDRKMESKDDKKKHKDKKKEKDKRREMEKRREEETQEEREERKRLKKEKRREKDERKRKAVDESTDSVQPLMKKVKMEEMLPESTKEIEPLNLKLKITLPFTSKPIATSSPIVKPKSEITPEKKHIPILEPRPSSSKSSHSVKSTPEKRGREKPPKIMSERVQLSKALKESMESAPPIPSLSRLDYSERKLDKLSSPLKKKKPEFKEKKDKPIPVPTPTPILPPVPPPVIQLPPAIEPDEDTKYWTCPKCSVMYREGGDDMVACEKCLYWYHWHCVGLFSAPPEDENWYCQRCLDRMERKKQRN